MFCVVSSWFHFRLSSWNWEAWYECLKNAIVQKKSSRSRGSLRTSYSGKPAITKYNKQIIQYYLYAIFLLFTLFCTRLPREVISFGHLSRGSDVYTMAMLFYQVYMAYSLQDDLKTVPFARRHRSGVNRRFLLFKIYLEFMQHVISWIYKSITLLFFCFS